MAQSERLAAIGALYCGETPTLPLLSKATGRTLNGLNMAAKRCGWKQPSSKPIKTHNADKVSDLLLRVEHIMDQKLQDGVATKSDVDEMLNLLKLVEKLSGTAAVLGQQTKSIATETPEGEAIVETSNIRGILKKIDQRIQELAERRAEALLNERESKI